MKLPFVKRKPSIEELERQAGEELEAAMARAKPPSEAERTWAKPESAGDWRARAASLTEPPEIPQAPARPAARRGPLLPRVPGGDAQGDVDGQADEAPPAAQRAASPRQPAAAAPAPAAAAEPAAVAPTPKPAKATGTAKRASVAAKKAPAKKAGSATRKTGPTRRG